MEKNLDAYIRRLVELDSRAVAYREERDAELKKLEIKNREEMKHIDSVLEKAASIARQRHEDIIGDARRQAEEIEKTAELKINELKTVFLQFKEDAAKDIWRQLLEVER